jgi:hypothetical protein
MGIAYISTRLKYKKELEDLKKENEELRNRIKLLEEKLLAYGYNPKKEKPFDKKSTVDKISEILGVVTSCYPDYPKAAEILSSYESEEVPKTEEEIKRYITNLQTNLTKRECYSKPQIFPETSNEEIENKIYPQLRLLFEKNPNKLILPRNPYRISPEEAEKIREETNEFIKTHPKLPRDVKKQAEKQLHVQAEPYKEGEVEGHILLGRLYGIMHNFSLSIPDIPSSLELIWEIHRGRSLETEEMYIALDEEDAKQLFGWKETPPEFKEGKYRHDYRITPLPLHYN